VDSKEARLQDLYQGYAETEILQQVRHRDGKPKTLVMPKGPLDSPLAIVGEAPGRDEEQTGEPFTGNAGRLLQELFAEAMIPWQFCYRANVLPWRPSLANRTPYPFEIDASVLRVQAEIALVGPQIVIAAGAVAWQGITARQIMHFAAARGRWVRNWSPGWYAHFQCDLLAIYHPAALLHAPATRRSEMRAETVAALRSVLAGERVAAA
jgi:uracil-DNA glycosylase family 4